jgi:nicotinate-nucleotide--dimethylbenzimidazole phosphoribosyltransferase
MNRLNEALDRMSPPSVEWRENAYERLRQQARPAGSLGVLEDVGARLAGIARRSMFVWRGK